MKTVAITGAGGFIGRRIAAAALDAGWRVRALTRSTQKIGQNYDPVQWDMEAGVTPDLLDGVDAVCHGAAYRPDDLNDETQAGKCMRINAEGTLALLRAAQAAGISRFVYMSAGNAYNSTQKPIPESAQIFPARRATYYLASKLVGEIYVSHWCQTGKTSGCILRISSVYGPGMDERGLIAAMARKLAAGQVVTLRNAGNFGADMVYVDDVAHAAIVALDAPFRGPVNIGSGELSTAHEIAEELVSIIGAPRGLIEVEPAGPTPDTSFGALDISVARRELRHIPTPLRDGLTRYWNSIREITK